MTYTVRPISDRTRFTGKKRRHAQFDSPWTHTEALLLDEIRKLNGRNIVLELDVREGDIRIDGQIRANARPSTACARVIFDVPRATHTYATDRFYRWQDNVRAIALGLEALRKIERYGIAESDQQYLGFKALPPGRDAQIPTMSEQDAHDLIVSCTGPMDRPMDTRWKFARTHAHPDHNDGDRELWDKLEEAGKALGYLR